MKPIIILQPDTMSPEDIKLLRDNDLCVVVAKNPALVKFIDPIPAQSCRTQIEDAAIKLSRKLLSGEVWDETTRANISKMYVDILIRGTPLDRRGTAEEQEKLFFDEAKADEIRKLAREEAKAERESQKKNMKGTPAK